MSLADLLTQATRVCECGHPMSEHDDHGCIHVGAEHCARKGNESWENLIALAPDLAKLAIDMAAMLALPLDEVEEGDCADLLASFAALDQRATT